LPALHRSPPWLTEVFDRTIRPLLYDADRIVRPFISPGDRVADIGCGAGYFSPTLSRLAGPKGELVLLDAQEVMLEWATARVREDPLARARLTAIRAEAPDLPLPAELDFALMSWMLHEVERPEAVWARLQQSLRPGGKVLVIEPLLHVSARRFEEQIAPALELDFVRAAVAGIFFSRAVVMTRR
jgi:ubiquinone/menaquinone biosynthesis C-methylase UbiE